MKRTTIYFEPELEVLLKLEMLRQKRPMAEIVREAVYAYVARQPRDAPPGAGAFDSRTTDTAERAEETLASTGFGRDASVDRSDPSAPKRRARPRR